MQNADNRMAEMLLKMCCIWPCQNKPKIKISAKSRNINTCKEHLLQAIARFNNANSITNEDEVCISFIGISKFNK